MLRAAVRGKHLENHGRTLLRPGGLRKIARNQDIDTQSGRTVGTGVSAGSWINELEGQESAKAAPIGEPLFEGGRRGKGRGGGVFRVSVATPGNRPKGLSHPSTGCPFGLAGPYRY
jgi:hypothetical protein